MVKQFFDRQFGKRYAFEVALFVALLIIGVNEYTYRSTTSVLRSGIALTDERISAARLGQILSDAEKCPAHVLANARHGVPQTLQQSNHRVA